MSAPLALALAALVLALLPTSPPVTGPQTAPPLPPPSGNPPSSATPQQPAAQALATPGYHFVYRATPAPNTTPFPRLGNPEIEEIDLSDATVTPPATVRARILTNDAVTSVVAETFGQVLPIARRAPGIFALEVTIGEVPRYLRNRTYDVAFTATAGDGRTVSVTLPLTLK